MYGFHKSRKDNAKCIFSHPDFLKGQDRLLPRIKRKIKNTLGNTRTPHKDRDSSASADKQGDETCEKDKLEGRRTGESAPPLTGLLESANYFNSFINLNVSLKRISLNNIDCLENKEEDEMSIAENMESGR
jgi:hypothetical protein